MKFLILCCAFAVPAPLFSATLTLESVPARVRTDNLSLAAARLRIREAQGRHAQAGRLANPELETEARHSPQFREGSLSIGFSQKFPITARLRLEKAVAASEVAAAQAEVANVERELIAEAEAAAVKLLSLSARRSLRQKLAENAKQLAEFATKGAGLGEVSPLDAGQARLESSQLSLEIRQLDAEAAEVTGALKTLLGCKAAESLTLSGSLPPPAIPAAITSPANHRPDYLAAKISADAGQQEIDLEKARRVDDMSAGLFAEGERTEDKPEGLKNEAMIGLRFSIPLPFWNKNEGAVQEKTARYERLTREVAALENKISNEAAASLEELRQLAALLTEIEKQLLPQGAEQLSRAENAYRSGQGDLLAVLRSRDQQIKLETARLDTLRDFHLARIRFEAATGKHTK